MTHLKPELTDAVIVGGGPVGSYLALNLSKNGVKASVFEEHSEIGFPSHCAGHISIRSLKNMGLYTLPKGIVENNFSTANFYSPQGTQFTINLSCPVTTVIDRARFDQYLANQAKAAGAQFLLNSRVQSLRIKKGCVKGIDIKHANGKEDVVRSSIVFDAEGISSRILRQAGLTALKPSGLVYAVETEIDNVQDIEQDAVEVYFGKSYAPGFYGWLIPRLDGTAKLGLATNTGNPREYLKSLMTKHPIAKKQLARAKITKIGYHAITLGGPISRAYADGFLAVGDCASQVKPTTGGGVIFGLKCASEAAEVASQALKVEDVSSNTLREYQKRCNDLLNFDIKVMLRIRKFLNSLSDEQLDEMLRICRKLGVDKALTDVTEIDFQGKMLVTAMRKPSMFAALGYFGLLYLFANA